MHGGEEQYLEGMMDWDGGVNRKYDEYKQIASEFKKIEKFFPYKVKADVGLAFSFPSQIASSAFLERHDAQLAECFNVFFRKNIDTRVVEITKSPLNYKLLVIPGVTVMDTVTARKIREFIYNGSTVIMTANSAVTNETGKVFSATHPGLLSDVFGIRVSGYEETENFNEISPKNFKNKDIEVGFGSKNIKTESARFDVIHPQGAKVLGSITSLDKSYPVITTNKYGKGTAIYLGLSAKSALIDPLIDSLTDSLSLKQGPEVPEGVMARFIDSKHILYLNLTGKPQTIDPKHASKSILFDKDYAGSFSLAPYEPEFIELR
jgi:beta-galactosidase